MIQSDILKAIKRRYSAHWRNMFILFFLAIKLGKVTSYLLAGSETELISTYN